MTNNEPVIPPSLKAILDLACAEPTLAQALTKVALWENSRSVAQALRRSTDDASSYDPNGAKWESCFEFCFTVLIERFKKTDKIDSPPPTTAIPPDQAIPISVFVHLTHALEYHHQDVLGDIGKVSPDVIEGEIKGYEQARSYLGDCLVGPPPCLKGTTVLDLYDTKRDHLLDVK